MAVYANKVSTYSDGDIITSSLFNSEFNQIIAVFNKSSGHTHDNVDGDGGPITKLRGQALTFGTTGSATDVTVTFATSGNSGLLTWDQSADKFIFGDAVEIAGNLEVTGTIDFGDQALANVGNINLDSITGDEDADTSITFSGSDVITMATGGATRFVVNSTGVDVTGTITADGLTMLDSEKITLGAGGDLEIYHNGSNSVIEEKGTGNLFIKGTDLVLEDTSGNKFFKGVAGGAVQIWHNAASHATAKLATTATGIDVTGTVTADGLTMGDNEKITLGTGGDLEIYHDGSNSHILDKGTGSLSLDTAHFALRSGATDSADTTPTEHIRMQVLAGASGSTAFSAGNESSGSLSGGMTNPRLEINPLSGSTAGSTTIRGKLNVAADPVDSSTTGSGNLGVVGDISAVNLDLGGNIEIDGEITKTGGGNLVINSSTEIKRSGGTATTLSILHTGTSLPSNAVLELGGTNGAHMDFKEPSSDDYDLRIDHGVNADNESLITSKHPLIIQTESSGGEVTIKREGSTKLATASTGIDVTGKITATVSAIGDNDVAVYGSGVADDDFLRINGTDVEGRSASEVLSDIGAQASLTFGISNTNAVKIDSSSVADDEYARFTANGLESRSTSEVLSDIGALSSSGNAASATLAKGSAEVVSSSATTGHATVAGYVGKTVIYTASSGDLTLGVPQCTEDLAVGEQIHFVNAATNSSSKIILDINEGHSDTQTISICTGATVTAESSADPHIVQGGVATLIAVSANNYVLFGSGVVDN